MLLKTRPWRLRVEHRIQEIMFLKAEVIKMCSWRKVLQKVLENSQENTRNEEDFIKNKVYHSCFFILSNVWILRIFGYYQVQKTK